MVLLQSRVIDDSDAEPDAGAPGAPDVLRDVGFLTRFKAELTLHLGEIQANGYHSAVEDVLLLKRGVFRTARRIAAAYEPGIAGVDSPPTSPSGKHEQKTGGGFAAARKKEKAGGAAAAATSPTSPTESAAESDPLEALRGYNTDAYGLYTDCVGLIKELETAPRKAQLKLSGDRPCRISDEGVPVRSSNGPTYAELFFSMPVSRRLETLAVFIFNFFVGIPLSMSLYVAMLWWGGLAHTLLIAYHVYWLVDWLLSEFPKKPQRWYRNHALWRYLRNYFPIRLRIEDASLFPAGGEKGAKPENYLFVLHPHGLHSFGGFINFGTNANKIDDMLPGLTIYLQTLGIQFHLPFWREVVRFAGCGDAGRGTISSLLKGPAGNSALLVVGGAEEALDAHPGTFDIILKKRKGFVKIAMQTGASLVPCFSFGENDIYYTYSSNQYPKMRKALRWMQSRIGFAITPFHGRGMFNYHSGILPHRRQITTVVGKPIKVEKWEGPWDTKNKELTEKLDSVHATYCQALTELFDTHKVCVLFLLFVGIVAFRFCSHHLPLPHRIFMALPAQVSFALLSSGTCYRPEGTQSSSQHFRTNESRREPHTKKNSQNKTKQNKIQEVKINNYFSKLNK